MSFRRDRHLWRRPVKVLLPVVVAATAALVLSGSSLARTTNVAQLDDGTCGRNLQLGSDRTASSSATPTFLLWGDGGLSSYAAFIDGAPIGTFNSDGFANVCITTSVPLSDGPHTLTANELRPNSTFTSVPFSFSVDTTPPAQPSIPVISSFSDSGFQGDHVTRFRNPNFTGFADPNVSVQLFNGVTLLGGAKADANGAWSATTSQLPDGTYTVTAAAFDQAGNKSILSLSTVVTIDGTAPTGGVTSPTDGSTVSGTVPVTAAGSDVSGIWKVDFQVDGGAKTTTSASPFAFSWNTASVANGSHTLTATIHDFPDNTRVSTITVNVQNGAATTPGAPQLSSAVAGNGSVTLFWSAPSTDGGSAVTGYRIYRGTSSGSESLLTTAGSATSFTDAGVANGTTYYYKVSAVNAVGEGAQSNERSAAPAAPATVPSAPVLSSAVAGNGSVTLSWSAPADGGSPLTSYAIYRGTTSGGQTLLSSGLSLLTSYVDTGAVNGTTYYYKVTASNLVGESARSNERSATPVTVPDPPTLLTAAPGNGSVTLSWAAPASDGGSSISGYKLYRGTSSGGETLLTTLANAGSYTDTGLANGTTYYYRVSAFNSVGEGAQSIERSARPATAPAPPTLDAATSGDGTVALSWSAPSSNGGSAVTGYRVYRGTTANGETLLATLGTVTSFADAGLANGTTYYYKVAALNGVGESIRSNELSALPASAPGAPTLTSAAAGTASVTLAWSAPASNGGTGITGYRVYRATASGGEALLTTLGAVSTWTNTGLTPGTTYYYKVSALNSVGEGTQSNERSATPVAAATAPAAPSLDSAAPGNASVALSWSAPLSDGGSPLTGYRVYRGTSSGGETLLISLGNVTSYTDASAANGTTYFYKVTALNAVGESAQSNERSALPATVPGVPTSLAATPGNGSVSLTWTAPASSGGSPVIAYRIHRSGTSGTESFLTSVSGSTSWTDTGLTNGNTYFYKVTAVNLVGESAFSSEASATPAGVPAAPSLTSATAGNGNVALSWSAGAPNGSAVTGYKVYRGTSSGGETLLTSVGNVGSFTDSGLTNGTTYFYRVTAVNAVGEGAQSNERSATPATAPGAPSLTASAGNASVALSWSAASPNGAAVSGYNVYRGTSTGGETLLTRLGSVTSFTDAGVANGTTYYYRVSAVNSAGEGGLSNERSATPAAPASIPGAPTLDAADAVTGSVTLRWSAPASNGGSALTGYRVYRSTTSGSELLLTTLGTETTYTDATVQNGATYYYVVGAVNGVGEGLPSNERSATPPAPATVPAAPGLNSAGAGDGSVTLSWTSPADGGSALAGYRVYRGTSSGTETLFATLGPQTTFMDATAQNGNTYFYLVTAVNAVGEGPFSNELSATPATTPGAPSLLSAVPGNSVTLTWNAPPNGGSTITAYSIYRGTVSGGETFLTQVAPGAGYVDETTSSGTTYYYRVAAVNALGEGALSNELSATPVAPDQTPPSKPTSLKSLVAGTSQLALNWAAATDNVRVTRYQVYRDGALVATVDTTHYLDSGLGAGTSHAYQVRAVDAAGNVSVASTSLTGRVASLSTGTTGTLAGVAYNAAGKLLSNVTFSLRLANGTVKSARTSNAGVWKLSSLAPGQYSIGASLPGFQAQTLSLAVVSGQTRLSVTVLVQ